MHSTNLSTHPGQPTLRAALPGLSLWLILLAVYGLYLPGLQATLQFDDQVNLQGLGRVADAQSALVFVASGISGPLSRPVSLASFLLNRGDWPANPSGLLHTNLLIHLLNGALLTWLTLRLVRLAQSHATPRSAWIAVSAAGLWLLLPLLASTSLIVIQRMTSLSATFVLAGILTYLVGLSWEAGGRKNLGRAIQLFGIGLGTLLATFAKENGALLPLYALILEATVLATASAIASTRRWRMVLLALPPLLLFGYLATQVSPANFGARNFTLTERLLTQPIILWDYVRLALLPQANAFTPFHDDYPIAHGLLDPPTALIAALAWPTLSALALWKRKSWPLFALAVLWYLGGHALESSAIPLELYFEHRNYLPLAGPMLAAAWGAWSATGTWQRTGPALLAAYALLLAGILWQTTSLWGQPSVAAEIWSSRHPASLRAIQYLASRYQSAGDQAGAHRLLAQAAERAPGDIDLALGALQLACESNEQPALEQDLARVRARLTTGNYGGAAYGTITNLLNYRIAKRCPYLSADSNHELLDLLLANPHYQDGTGLNNLHHLKARLYREQRNFDGTMTHLMAAYRAAPDIGTAGMIIGTLMSGGLYDKARAFLTAERNQYPRNPVLRDQWVETMERLSVEIDKDKSAGRSAVSSNAQHP